MTLTGIADKTAAQTLLAGSPGQAASLLNLLRETAGNAELFRRIDAGTHPGLARGLVGIALLQRHLLQGGSDDQALNLLVAAANHIKDQQSLEWVLRVAPNNVHAHSYLAKAAHIRGDEAKRDGHFSALIDVLARAVSSRDYDKATDLENFIYNDVVKLVEEETFVHAKLARIIPLMDELGRHLRGQLPDLPQRQSAPGATRVGFVFPHGVMLAHTKVLLSICQAMNESGVGAITPYVYVAGKATAEFIQPFEDCGVPVHVIGDATTGPTKSITVNRLLELRQKLAADGIRLATWVSVPAGGAFYTAARFAPQQAYWSMKFHGMIAPGIDHYVSCMSSWETEKIVHGQKWLCGPIAFKDALAGGDPTKVPEIRARYGKDAILLGVLAREEKIFSLPYLGAVAEILESCPKAVFLWSGRSEHAGIRKFFADRGLNARTPYIGWVNTATYAPALDIFLETFPFGCGMTAAQALAAGVPVVDFKDWSSVFGFHLEPLLSGRAGTDEDRAKVHALFTGSRGEDCFNMASDTASYVAIARRLIDDPDYRREAGAAGQRFYRAYLGNSVFSAERFARIFRDLAQHEQPQRKAG